MNQWLRSIPRDERPGFLVRLAANIEVIHTSELANLEPGCEDAVLSYAILIEYAQHLGVSPAEACWSLELPAAENVDVLLAARVDRMLADADHRKTQPRRRGDDAAIEATAVRSNRGLSSHWKATPSRRGKDRRSDERGCLNWSPIDTLAFHSQPGRAG